MSRWCFNEPRPLLQARANNFQGEGTSPRAFSYSKLGTPVVSWSTIKTARFLAPVIYWSTGFLQQKPPGTPVVSWSIILALIKCVPGYFSRFFFSIWPLFQHQAQEIQMIPGCYSRFFLTTVFDLLSFHDVSDQHLHLIQSIYCLSLIHIWRCRRKERCRSRWSPYH